LLALNVFYSKPQTKIGAFDTLELYAYLFSVGISEEGKQYGISSRRLLEGVSEIVNIFYAPTAHIRDDVPNPYPRVICGAASDHLYYAHPFFHGRSSCGRCANFLLVTSRQSIA